MDASETPYAGLTPDTVLNAIDSVGLVTDGRQLALNSYENRVFQVGLEDGSFVVAKFYRPGRWSDAAILEEHEFVAELATHEIPAVPALVIAGRTLHRFDEFRFSVFPRRGGRAPNLDDPDVRIWRGRFLGRIHAVGRVQRYAQRPAARRCELRRRAAQFSARTRLAAARAGGRLRRRWLTHGENSPLRSATPPRYLLSSGCAAM